MTAEAAAYSCAGALTQLCRDAGIPKMRDVSRIDPKDFREIAEASFRNLSTPDNPREITVDYYLLTKAYNTN